MRLDALLAGVEVLSRSGARAGTAPAGAGALPGGDGIAGLHYDSRRIRSGQAFVAIRGEVADGNAFIPQALARGATVIVSERERATAAAAAGAADGAVWVRVANPRRALATMAANWFGRPAERLRLVGVTGTNGKTTTALLCESILRAGGEGVGEKIGLLGTIEYHIGDEVLPSPHTTPESYDLQELLARMVAAGCTAAVLEVSSHALAMDRVWGCPWAAAAFTNLTQDHLDFHGTMEAYREAKRRLFVGTGAGAPRHSIFNADDPNSAELARGGEGRAWWYSAAGVEGAEVRARQVTVSAAGLRLEVASPAGDFTLASPLLARVNAENLLAAATVGLALGRTPAVIQRGVAELRRVPGRFERVDAGQPFTVVVDYAHTPDALARALRQARELAETSAPTGRVLALFGCGGDRDRGKRPLMGQAAAAGADWVVVTSDNPRSEDPEAIIAAVAGGMGAFRPVVEPDRRAAIARALAEARPGDVVLLAGKGHETEQIIGERRLPFDDREEARAALRARAACS